MAFIRKAQPLSPAVLWVLVIFIWLVFKHELNCLCANNQNLLIVGAAGLCWETLSLGGWTMCDYNETEWQQIMDVPFFINITSCLYLGFWIHEESDMTHSLETMQRVALHHMGAFIQSDITFTRRRTATGSNSALRALLKDTSTRDWTINPLVERRTC